MIYHRCHCPYRDTKDCAHPWHYKFEHDGVHYRGSTRLTKQDKAAEVAIKKQAAIIERGAGVPVAKAPLLSALITDYLSWARADHPATADTKDAKVLAFFLQQVKDKRLTAVTPFDAERWRSRRGKVFSRGRLIGR